MYKLGFLALVSLAHATTWYDIQTVTDDSTVEVTVTSCSGHPSCAVEAVASTYTVVTSTINGEETVYTTVCPLTESQTTPHEEAAEVSSDDITFVDVTTTPTITQSTGVEATVQVQSTFTSVYHNSSLAAVEDYEGGANKLAIGAGALVGVALLL